MGDTAIQRDGILGLVIDAVLQTSWRTSSDRIVTCLVYVRLANGVTFLLGNPEGGVVYMDDLADSLLVPVEYIAPNDGCNGEVILDVVVCSEWPSYGVLLASGRLLHIDCAGDVVGAAISSIDAAKDIGRYFSIWDGQDICDKLGTLAANRGSLRRF